MKKIMILIVTLFSLTLFAQNVQTDDQTDTDKEFEACFEKCIEYGSDMLACWQICTGGPAPYPLFIEQDEE